ncbi:MAG: glycosyltransferase family 4 protein [Solirubrobacteraceae bacterium]
MRVHVVDPPAFTPPYDHALCSALARAGASVELVTSRFGYGDVPAPEGYAVRRLFYRRARGAPGSRRRRIGRLAQHGPDMLRYRAMAGEADVVHFQWLAVPWLDALLLPDRPLVLTAHDLLPREPRPGQVAVQRRLLERVDAVIVHSGYGRAQLVDRLGVPTERVHVIHHGAFAPPPPAADTSPCAPALPAELPSGDSGPVVLFFGLLRPYKGLETLLTAWQGVPGAQLWIVGRPMMDLEPLRALATPSVSWVTRFVSEAEAQAVLGRADVVVLPYARTERFDQSGVLASALGHGKAIVLSDVGGFSEVAAAGAAVLAPAQDPAALRVALAGLVADPAARARLGAAALAAAQGPYSWDGAARRTLALYERLLSRPLSRR